MKKLLIIGAGGHGRVIADCAELTGRWAEIQFLDDRHPELASADDWPVAGTSQSCWDYFPGEWDVIVGIGDNRVRLQMVEKLLEAGFTLPVLVHPSAAVSPRATLAEGTVVFAQVAVNTGAQMGRGVILNTGCIVDHDCRLSHGVHVSPGAALAGNVTVGCCSWIGIGASIRHCIEVGQDVIIGGGAAVVANVPDSSTMVGVPAKNRIA